MTSECRTIQHLKQLSLVEVSNDSALANAAISALNIISDIRAYGTTDMNMEHLHWLVEAISKDGGRLLLSDLEQIPDCEICAGMAVRMKT